MRKLERQCLKADPAEDVFQILVFWCAIKFTIKTPSWGTSSIGKFKK